MKKAFTLFNIVALLGICAAFTSCTDEDVDESMILSGQWQGNWGMYYDYEYRGKIYTFDSYDTDIVFYPEYDYATYGYGYQVDWYNRGPYTRMSYRFRWSIKDGIVYLTYPGYPEYNTSIREYYLNNSRFTGYFTNGTEKFTLHKIADYYDWSYYYDYGDYHYWYNDSWSWGGYYDGGYYDGGYYGDGYYYDDYYYAKTRETVKSEPADSVKEGRIVKVGSRLAE